MIEPISNLLQITKNQKNKMLKAFRKIKVNCHAYLHKNLLVKPKKKWRRAK